MRIFLTVVATALLTLPATALAQISPGELARAHRALEGPTQCVKCHGLKRDAMNSQCVACHKEIAWSIDRNRGLHARDGKKRCAGCHPDHAGVGFALIAWPEGSPERFNHTRAGWALDGKHADAKCESCHTMKFRISAAASLSPRKTSPGWLGLETACASCHRSDDVHKSSLGAKCESCHDTRDWKPASNFDHATTDYPLTGKHADVACDKCHLSPRLGIIADATGKRIPRFKPVPFKECSSCHDDPHKGRLSRRCGECHVTRGFGIIDRNEFDHSLTRYALSGKHRSVSCSGCHGTNLSKKNPPFATCAGCHSDPHRGEATLAGRPVDCNACHRVEGFSPSTFTVEQHEAARYPLAGKHRQVRCSSCHTSVTRMRPQFARCTSCHADSHGGQLANRPDQGACDACHVVNGWKPSTYPMARHATLRLPLDGRHAVIPCAACHAASRTGLPAAPATLELGSARVILRVQEVACGSCHFDPHAGRYSESGAVPMANGCGSCHGTSAFRPTTMTLVTHARFSFALEGAHRAVPCVACHAEMKSTTRPLSTLVKSVKGVTALPYNTRRASTCQSCHESPHGSQFAGRKDGGACEGCHDVSSFASAARFDHERDASFSLKGAHSRLACSSCHKPSRAGAAVRIVYKPLSGKCESCHSGKAAGAP